MPSLQTSLNRSDQHSRSINKLLPLPLIVMLFLHSLDAQPRKNQYGPYRTSAPGPSTLIIESDPSAQLLEGFMLMQKANGGDPVAEQEVGLRYLFGRGFPYDTVRAALWVRKAADQNLTTAKYNLAIMTNNGWGTDWNPFVAYNLFSSAAQRNMMEAQFSVALIIVDNLVVPRDWNLAYQYLTKSAEQGYKPAAEILAEFVKRGIHAAKDTTKAESTPNATTPKKQKGKPDSVWAPVFLDLQRDPPTALDDSTLLKEAYREANLSSMHPFETTASQRRRVEDDTAMKRITEAAEVGNPESLALIGRLYEEGIGVRKDLILAAEYYVRAVRFDSPRASQLLWKLIREEQFRKILEDRSPRDDPDALFVWAGLTALQFDQTLNEEKALELLQKAAAKHHLPALVELGLCSYQGRWVKQDKNAAIAIWNEATSMGSKEAEVRIAAARMTGDFSDREPDISLPLLFDAAQQGSLIAQLALAYCYERGVGMQRSKGEAAKLYRICAQRGSENAYNALRRMYDELRPKEKQYTVE